MQAHPDDPPDTLGWHELRAAIVERRDRAGAAGAVHWERLRELVDARLAAAPSAQAPPVRGVRWWLSRVRVSGFRGVRADLELSFEPGPGLTVVHAPNGTGKSSVADAVRAALWGSPAPLARALWAPVDRSAGAARARVEVVLTGGSDELRCRWSDDGRAGAVLRTGGRERVVSVADPDWQAALAAGAPVFSYAETQDRLGRPQDLVRHLDDLVALGPCFALLAEDVAGRSAAATAARERLTALKRSARAALAAVDGADAVALPVRFTAPDPDAWLAGNDLVVDPHSPDHRVTDEDLAAVGAAARHALGALDRLDDAEQRLADGVDDRVHPHLVDLHSDLYSDLGHDPGGPCPVCGRDGAWWAALSGSAGRLADWAQARRAVDAAAEDLASGYRATVRPLLAGALAALPEPPRHGGRAGDRARLRAAAEALLGPDLGVLAARDADDRRLRAARREAVEPLVRAWRLDGPLAATAYDWSRPVANLSRLRAELRDPRGTALGREVADVLDRLLADAPVRLGGVAFRGDALRLVGDDGGDRALGTLSAGQRNALVLAPLLRARAVGPFGFLLVDDPVHAFDDLRVDLVADELVRLADDRRVVVLTHDSRLAEALTAKRRDADVLALARDAAGALAVTDRAAPWAALLADAEDLLKMGTLPADLGRLPVAVRGLCRHALDGALRGLALRWAAETGADLAATVADLDRDARSGERSTRARLQHAERFGVDGRPSPAPVALHRCERFLRIWNEAAHGTGGDTRQGLTAEVAAARAACTALAAW